MGEERLAAEAAVVIAVGFERSREDTISSLF